MAATDDPSLGLWPLTEDNDGRCRCGRPATDLNAQLRCGWHASVAVARLRRLRAAGDALPPGYLQTELRELSANIEGVPGPVDPTEHVDHPAHYGGGDDPYETIKVLEAWLTPEQASGFRRGNAVKYVSRAGRKGDELEDLRKARWYLDREIAALEARRG